ncbi:hypothetical protein M9H77_35473 [Catharanthus roseus]|uniref:Uncharacterized protein n=1 Tax=Catharanthus roseus TaxID=4058 RepID=A0ACB9ZPU7_CATRO|nr:hypothetical protein M9H77_35473 [Catharanthus roseus]
MEDDLCHVQQALKGLEQQLSHLAKGRRDFGGYPIYDNQWGYGNFSSHVRSYEPNSYACYESNRLRTRDCYNGISCKGIPRNDVRNGGNYVNMDERSHKSKVNELSQAQDVIDRKVIHNEKRNTCTFVKEEKSREGKVKSFSFKELKLFLESYASYVTLVLNVMDNPLTCDLAFDIDHMLKYSSPCAYLHKLLLFHAKLKGELVENCDYESSFLYTSMKTLDGFISSI